MISDDFYDIFRVVKHSKKILADNQLFTGLRDGSPGLSLGTPLPPYGALPKSCLHQSTICRRMGIYQDASPAVADVVSCDDGLFP